MHKNMLFKKLQESSRVGSFIFPDPLASGGTPGYITVSHNFTLGLN